MAKPTAQQCHALTTYFINRYSEERGKAPRVNRNKTRFGFESILMDYTPQQARELIDFYIEHYADPTVEWLIYNYEKVDEAMVEKAKNDVLIAHRRAETKKRLEEWSNRWKNQS